MFSVKTQELSNRVLTIVTLACLVSKMGIFAKQCTDYHDIGTLSVQNRGPCKQGCLVSKTMTFINSALIVVILLCLAFNSQFTHNNYISMLSVKNRVCK